jgi:hypothetical protein
MPKPFDWTARIENAIARSGLSRDEFLAQSDQMLLRYPTFGLKTIEFLRTNYGGGPPLDPGLATYSDDDLRRELDRRYERSKWQRRLTDHG